VIGVEQGGPDGLVIRVQEFEQTVLNADNSISRFDAWGRVFIRNNSRRSSIWDAELELNRDNMTTLGQYPLDIGRLDPIGEWEKEFQVKEISTPLLVVTEVVDTFHERAGINNSLVCGRDMPVEFTITLRNHAVSTITDIVVMKTIPRLFERVELPSTYVGSVAYDPSTGQVTWTLKELPEDRMAVLHIRATIRVEDINPVPAGALKVTYRVPGLLRSHLHPTLHGVTECQTGVDWEEHPMRPGAWRCRATLTNTSDFTIRLEQVQIVQSTPETHIIYEGKPHLLLEPGEVWGHEFDLSRRFRDENEEATPEIDVVALYTVETPIQQEITGTVEKEETFLPVLNVECSKRVEPLELQAWEPAPISVTLEAKNTGTAAFNEVTFIDTIPPDFEPPEPDQVRVRVGDRPITRSLEIRLKPDNRDPAVSHTITIRVHDLTDAHASVEPGHQVTASYIAIARTPKPNHEYPLPLTVQANSFPPGPPAEAYIRELDAPTIRVRFTQRRLRKIRTVTPGPKAGEMLVTVTFINEGETNIRRPQLQDLIPPQFEYAGVPTGSPEPSISETMNGTLLTWTLDGMMSREKFTTRYLYRSKTG